MAFADALDAEVRARFADTASLGAVLDRLRAEAVAALQDSGRPYVINWDSVACDNRDFLVMGNPFHDYRAEVARFLARLR